MTRATFSTQVLRFTRGFVFYLSPISISRVPEKKVASTLIVFFFYCEQSLIFLYKVTVLEINPSNASAEP